MTNAELKELVHLLMMCGIMDKTATESGNVTNDEWLRMKNLISKYQEEKEQPKTNGDLISRSALKKALREAHINMELTFGIASYGCVMNIIDKAPTVDTTCPHCDSGYAQGYSDGYLRGKEERPQGKWIYHKAVDYFLPCMECNNCHEEFLLNDLTPAYFKKVNHFCSNCGADMRKGSTE